MSGVHARGCESGHARFVTRAARPRSCRAGPACSACEARWYVRPAKENDLPAVEVTRLEKRYGTLEAVRGIDFTVEAGEVFALLGPNGAGKTTTLEMLEGFSRRSGGEVRVLGVDPAQRRSGVARARRASCSRAPWSSPISRCARCCERNAGLLPEAPWRWTRCSSSSVSSTRPTRVRRRSRAVSSGASMSASGSSARPSCCSSTSPRPGSILRLGEGPGSSSTSSKAKGTTIILTTHYMDEAQHLADRVVVINRGEIVASGTPETIGGRAKAAARIRFELPPGVEPPALAVAARS